MKFVAPSVFARRNGWDNDTSAAHTDASVFLERFDNQSSGDVTSDHNDVSMGSFMLAANGSVFNGSFDFGDAGTNPFAMMPLRVLFILLYGVVFACCIVGNILVIVVILKHRKMRTITNFFLANLAVADLCVGIFCVLPSLFQYLSPTWPLGRVMCKLQFFIQCVSYTASIVILTVISLERYFAIIHPILSKRLSRMCLMRIVAVCVWVIACVYGSPMLIAYDAVTVPAFGKPNQTETFCIRVKPLNMQAFSMANFVLWYVVPLVVMSTMYARISLVLWHSGKLGVGKMSGSVYQHTSCNNAESTFTLIKRQTDATGTTEDARPRPKSLSNVLVHAQYNAVARAGIIPHENGACAYDASAVGGPGRSSRSRAFSNPCGASARDREVPMVTAVRWQHNLNSRAAMNNLSQSGVGGGLNNPDEDNRKLIRSFPMTPRHASVPDTRSKAGKKVCVNPLVARRKVIRLLVVIIVTFALCVLPHHVRLLLHYWTSRSGPTFGDMLFPPLAFLLFYTNSCLNPFLYAFLSKNFRRAFKDLRMYCGRSLFRHTNTSLASTASRGLH